TPPEPIVKQGKRQKPCTTPPAGFRRPCSPVAFLTACSPSVGDPQAKQQKDLRRPSHEIRRQACSRLRPGRQALPRSNNLDVWHRRSSRLSAAYPAVAQPGIDETVPDASVTSARSVPGCAN